MSQNLNPENERVYRKLLRKAARMWGLQLSYAGPNNTVIWSSMEAVKRLLAAVTHHETETVSELEALIRRRRQEFYQRLVEPVFVFWGGERDRIRLRVSEAESLGEVRALVTTESGAETKLQWSLPRCHPRRKREIDGKVWIEYDVRCPLSIDLGYHRIQFSTQERTAQSLIIAAPNTINGDATLDKLKHSWGGFAPVHALRSEKDWGAGSLAELSAAQHYIHESGGCYVGALPLLAANFDQVPVDPSPYSPVSRLFWNEFYLDVDQLLEENPCKTALSLRHCEEFQTEMEELRDKELVDYDGVYKLKRQILELCAEEFFADHRERSPEYLNFLEENPEAEEYAEFRAHGDSAKQRYHLFVQYQMARQLSAMADRFRRGESAGLYLDYPVGVSRDGYDGRKYSPVFVEGVAAGAPPDALFDGGQNWGFMPYHPHALRDSQYEYFIRTIRNHVRYCQLLRVDHVMGFHRIYSVPDGLGAKEGAYLRFQSDEFYAILCLEALRCKTYIVGEDLGTVPAGVREKMKLRGMHRMWVYQMELWDGPEKTWSHVPERALASLNTHDMPPLKGYWSFRDIRILDDLKMIKESRVAELDQERKALVEKWQNWLPLQQPSTTLQKLTLAVAESPAELVSINFEDLWLEENPQNVPGTWKEYPNWRRRMKHALEEWPQLEPMNELLTQVSKARSDARRRTEGRGFHV